MTKEKAIGGVAAYLLTKYPLIGEKAVDAAVKAVNMGEALCQTSAPPKAPFSDRKTKAEFAPKQRVLLFGDRYDSLEGFYGHTVKGKYGYEIYVAWDAKVREVEIGKPIRRSIEVWHKLRTLSNLCISRPGPVVTLDDLFHHVPKSTRKLMTTHKYLTAEFNEGVIGLGPITGLEFGHSSSVDYRRGGACVSMEAMNDLKAILTEEVHVMINKGLWIFSRWIGVHLPEEE